MINGVDADLTAPTYLKGLPHVKSLDLGLSLITVGESLQIQF